VGTGELRPTPAAIVGLVHGMFDRNILAFDGRTGRNPNLIDRFFCTDLGPRCGR
jgi:hypothetical protein